jgi:hypothetical protein
VTTTPKPLPAHEQRPLVLQAELLQWMRENLLLCGNIVRGTDGVIGFSQPFLAIAGGRVVVDGKAASIPSDNIAGWQCNSAAGLLACCYLEAMGKIVTDVDPSARDRNKQRFLGAISTLLSDAMSADDADLLWGEYRNAWTHAFIVWGVGWARSDAPQLWAQEPGGTRRVLNVSRLVELTLDAITELDRRMVAKFSEPVKRHSALLAALSAK